MKRLIALTAALVFAFVGTSPAQQLTQHWKLDEDTLTFSAGLAPLINSVPGGADGYVHNANAGAESWPTAGLPGAAWHTDTAIKLNTAFQRIPTEVPVENLGDNPFTIAFWFFCSAKQSGTDVLVSSNNGTEMPNGWTLELTGDTGAPSIGLGFFHRGWGGSGQTDADYMEVADAVVPNQWYHIAMVRSSDATDNLTLYLDGEVLWTLTDTVSFNVDATKGVWFGRRPDFGTTGYVGLFDDIRFYDDALTSDGVTGLIDPRLLAWDPDPAEGATEVPVNATFQWSTARDPADLGAVNPHVTAHRLYLQQSPTDPNFAAPIEIAVSGSTASHGPVALDYDLLGYRWRVDEVLDDDPSDPNVLAGPIWTFGTAKSVPIITQQPQNALVEDGDPAEIMVVVNSVSAAHYQWKQVNPEGEDPNIGTDSATLSFASATVADEAFYYCVVSNASGIDATSDPASVVIKRLMAWYPLNGDYFDVTGLGHDADPNGIPSYTTGADGTANGAAVISAENGWATAGTWDATEYSSQITISAWIQWDGTPIAGDGPGIVSKRAAETGNMDWSLYARPGDGSHAGSNWLRWTTWSGGDVWAGPELYGQDQWVHVVATVDGDGAGRLYVNGLQVSQDLSWNWDRDPEAPVSLGIAYVGGPIWPGALDDIRIYNYALDPITIAKNYTDVAGGTVCAVPPVFDLNGDCRVDLQELASFATIWLDCGLVPDCITP